MKDIFPDLDLWQSQGEEIALATLVQVRRSAPRPPGARLCVTRSGRMSGSVSGGCVEADVFERAIQILDSRNPELVNYGIADEMGFEVGLSCGGSIDVFIEPFVSDDEWDTLRRAVEGQQEVVYAIGLAPEALLGRKLTRVIDGRAVGSIDPSLDKDVAEVGDRLLRTGGTKVVTLPWRGGAGAGICRSDSTLAHPIDRRGHPRRRLPVPPRHRGGLSGHCHRRPKRAGYTRTFPRCRTANPCMAGGSAGASASGQIHLFGSSDARPEVRRPHPGVRPSVRGSIYWRARQSSHP